jgi:ubiquinone/menaquinone biosynthesis C-methylase UbiE
MPDSPSPSPIPDYGLDAPGAVRNLFIVAAAGLLARLAIVTHLWSGKVTLGPFDLRLGPMSLGLALGCGFMGAWMAWDSKFGKVRERERLLDLLTWTGRERVLDVGCGRGLLLIGAAKRLTTGSGGSAVGIDLWQKEDLSGNRPEAALENARLEGVADRVEVHTADMRTIPFPDGSFDTVLSMNAIHNIYSAPGRAAAIAEICRVLKPGGTVLIVDVRHIRQYAAALRAGGCTVRRASSDFGTKVLMVITLGMVRPGNLIARKDAQPAAARA